jgi:2-oxoglutarate ferredoxin oxidoreductase subunit alpha
MTGIDLTMEICGMSGDGTIAAGGLLNEAMSEAGFSVLGYDSYPAEIRGFGRCVARSRIGDQEILALEDRTDVLISLDDAQSQTRLPHLAEGAALFFDSNPPTYVKEKDSLTARVEPGTRLYGMPLADLASGVAGTSRGRNLTALGGFAAVYGISPDSFRAVIRKKFASKGEKVAANNVKSFDAGYEYALEAFAGRPAQELKAAESGEVSGKVLLSGNVAVGMAALDAGLKLYFGYPITPATPIMEYLAGHLPDAGGQVIQMEDEISSIGAVIGGFFAGARSMTATSGPGFALMAENLGHAVMTETPAVVVNVQRGGPSTGLPTKTEQSDLNAAVFGGPGDCPRIVVAPTNVAECYTQAVGCFQWAEKYQTPVILLTDFYLGNRVENVPQPVATGSEREDRNVYPEDGERDAYARFVDTDSGISPRAIPGTEGFKYSITGLEHVASGEPDYSPEVHTLMSEKRHRKIRGALDDLPKPVEYSDGGEMDLGVVSWGSTFGSVLEAVNDFRQQGRKVGALKVASIYPYHEDMIRGFMNRCQRVMFVELNYEGQLAGLIGHLFHGDVVRMTRVTGLPIAPSAIRDEIGKLLEAGAK